MNSLQSKAEESLSVSLPVIIQPYMEPSRLFKQSLQNVWEAVEINRLKVLNCLQAIDRGVCTSLLFNPPNDNRLLFPLLHIPQFESPIALIWSKETNPYTDALLVFLCRPLQVWVWTHNCVKVFGWIVARHLFLAFAVMFLAVNSSTVHGPTRVS